MVFWYRGHVAAKLKLARRKERSEERTRRQLLEGGESDYSQSSRSSRRSSSRRSSRRANERHRGRSEGDGDGDGDGDDDSHASSSSLDFMNELGDDNNGVDGGGISVAVSGGGLVGDDRNDGDEDDGDQSGDEEEDGEAGHALASAARRRRELKNELNSDSSASDATSDTTSDDTLAMSDDSHTSLTDHGAFEGLGCARARKVNRLICSYVHRFIGS